MNKIVKQVEKRIATKNIMVSIMVTPESPRGIPRTLTIKNFTDFMTKSL